MRGVDHGLLGVAAWLGVAPMLPVWLADIEVREPRFAVSVHHVTLPGLSAGQLAVGGILAAGAGLLPDWDHPDASAAHTFPGGHGVARTVAACTGGHRHGTHSILAVVASLAGGWWAGSRPWAAGLVVFMLAALTLHIVPWRTLRRRLAAVSPRVRRLQFRPRGRRLGFRVCQLPAAAAIALAVMLWVPFGRWLGVVCAVGVLSHCLADQFNPEGWQPFWPLLRWRLRTPLFRTAGRAEEIASVFFVAGDLYLLVWRF